MAKTALIVYGGWNGHQPAEVSAVFKGILETEGFAVEVSASLDSFTDEDKLMSLNLIIPVWTMGEIGEKQLKPVLKAVEAGVGLAGCHGGMGDAFRNCVEWQFMTGSQWVAHPGNDGVEYEVNLVKTSSSPIVKGIEDFKVTSEQYYIHVDPAVNVLATTTFPVINGPHSANGMTVMPVVYTKYWGKGKVFYTSLGHHADVFDTPEIREITKRGFLWAAK
jgi:type 1 glutamine amidotransferase